MTDAVPSSDGTQAAADTAECLAVRAREAGAAGQAAYSTLVKLYHGRVYNFLLRRLPAADAEDLTQEAFIRAWQRIDTYNPRYRFSTWIFTIATRLAISHGRQQKRSQKRSLVDNHADGGETRQDPGQAMLRLEERDRIWEFVGRMLSVEQQTVMWLRYVEEMPVADIAQVMRRTQVGVRVMLFRARNVLAEKLVWSEDGIAEARPAIKETANAKGPSVPHGAIQGESLCRAACAGSGSP